MRKKYIVTLTEEERRMLRELISRGKAAARKLMHARILLKADSRDGGPGWGDAAIAEGLDVGRATVERVRKRFVEEGLEAALQRRKPRRQYKRRLDGDGEAHLIALACSEDDARAIARAQDAAVGRELARTRRTVVCKDGSVTVMFSHPDSAPPGMAAPFRE